MFTVHFFENKNLLLSQWLSRVPAVGEDLKIKGRKAKVLSIDAIDEKTRHVQVVLEKVNKKAATLIDNSKKKKR